MSELAVAFDQALGELLPFPEALNRAGGDRSLPSGVREEILAMGWNGLVAPEQAAGLGLEAAEVIELCAVAGRHLLPVALLDEALLLAPALTAAGSSDSEAIVEGRVAGGAGYVADASAARDPEGGLSVSGVGVRLSPGAQLVGLVHPQWTAVIPLADSGVRLERTDALDRGQGVHLLTLASVKPHAVLEGWANGGEVAAGWLSGLLADLVGGARQVLAMSVSHAREREQFGRPLIRFQAVTHLLAEMKARLELMRSALARLAFLMTEGALDTSFLAAALWSVPAYARQVCESAIQVHGGIGFTWEYGLHLYYRRILSLQSMLGGALDSAAGAGRAYVETI